MSSLKKRAGKVRQLVRELLKSLRGKGLVLFFLGALIAVGLTWYFRGNVISGLKQQLSVKTNELSGYNQSGCTGIDGISTGCPNVEVIKVSQKQDSALKGNEKFLIAEVELSNSDKHNISLDIAQFKLKDANNYVFASTSNLNYNSVDENASPKSYASLKDTTNLVDQINLTLAAGEKIRGNLVFIVKDGTAPFRVSYFTSKSDEFKP